MSLENINIINAKYNLINIEYNNIPINSEISEMDVIIEDTIETNLEDHVLEIKVNRYVGFVPKIYFNLLISFSLELEIDDESCKLIKNTKKLKEEIIKSNNHYFDNMLSKISLLIAQITSSFSDSPIITPPIIIQKTK